MTLRVFGDYALRVADPVRLITNLTATVDVSDNERIASWVSDQLLKVLRTNVTTQIVRNGWPILGLMAYSAEIEQSAIETGNGQLDAYGIELTRMGNFDINLKPEDEAQLKQLAKDTSYSQLAGGFQRYAAGEMALGAGQGMAQGGAGTEAAFLAAGFGMGNVLGGQAAPPPPGPPGQYGQQPPYGQQPQGPGPQGGAPAPAPAGVVCAQCQAANPAGAKFCMGCGQALAPAVQHCTECGTDLPSGAHFCSSCGTRVGG